MWTGPPAFGGRPQKTNEGSAWAGMKTFTLGSTFAAQEDSTTAKNRSAQCRSMQALHDMIKDQETPCVVQILSMCPGPMCKGRCLSLNLHRNPCWGHSVPDREERRMKRSSSEHVNRLSVSPFCTLVPCVSLFHVLRSVE